MHESSGGERFGPGLCRSHGDFANLRAQGPDQPIHDQHARKEIHAQRPILKGTRKKLKKSAAPMSIPKEALRRDVPQTCHPEGRVTVRRGPVDRIPSMDSRMATYPPEEGGASDSAVTKCKEIRDIKSSERKEKIPLGCMERFQILCPVLRLD